MTDSWERDEERPVSWFSVPWSTSTNLSAFAAAERPAEARADGVSDSVEAEWHWIRDQGVPYEQKERRVLSRERSAPLGRYA